MKIAGQCLIPGLCFLYLIERFVCEAAAQLMNKSQCKEGKLDDLTTYLQNSLTFSFKLIVKQESARSAGYKI